MNVLRRAVPGIGGLCRTVKVITRNLVPSVSMATNIFRYTSVVMFGGAILGLLNYRTGTWTIAFRPQEALDPLNETVFEPPLEAVEAPGDRKIILLWNPFFNEPDYGVGGFGTTAFNKTNCSVTCWTTNDRSYLSVATAVIVHTFNMGPSGQNETIPKRAFKEQIFVFFILESQLRSYAGFGNANYSFTDVFNLTFTFIDDPETDIYIPMGGVKKLDKPDDSRILSLTRIRKKTEAVAWFVSNCNAPSARMEYAEELSKHIPVHIYGECGTYTCVPGDYECYVDVMKSHMFYLSFENSFCEGYVTEKLFRTLKTEMVPIVYGRANYSRLLRPKSYIDVRHFAYPKALAKYLNFLKRNLKEYQKYFYWKRNYSVLQEGDYKASGLCRLCEILHTENYPYKSNYDPVRYYDPERWCARNDDERQEVNLI